MPSRICHPRFPPPQLYFISVFFPVRLILAIIFPARLFTTRVLTFLSGRLNKRINAASHRRRSQSTCCNTVYIKKSSLYKRIFCRHLNRLYPGFLIPQISTRSRSRRISSIQETESYFYSEQSRSWSKWIHNRPLLKSFARR